MAEMGNYCKAYEVKRLREFTAWTEATENLRPEKEIVDGVEVETKREELRDDDILYVQENLVVTDGIFKDEHIVFQTDTEEWKGFCKDVLQFEIPEYAEPANTAGDEG